MPPAGARHASLAAQRRSEAQSQRQHAETLRQWQGLEREVLAEPLATGQAAARLAGRLVAELAGDADTQLRVLHGSSGPVGGLHAVNVTVLSLLLARQLELPVHEQQAVAVGALLHDVGKLLLPDTLRHAGPEQPALALRARRDHVVQGVRLGRDMGLEPLALCVIAQHHELFDGSGLPQGLRGADTARPARIVALVDRYDRLCNPLGAASRRTPHEAQAVLYAQMREQLDPAVLAGFVKLLGVYPPGTVVQLTDGRHALVVAAHPDHALQPSVLVHEAGIARDDALVLHLHDCEGLGIRRSVAPQHLPRATLDYLSPGDRLCWYYAHGLDTPSANAEPGADEFPPHAARTTPGTASTPASGAPGAAPAPLTRPATTRSAIAAGLAD